MNRRIMIAGGAILAVIVLVSLARLLFHGKGSTAGTESPKTLVEVRVAHPVGVSDTLVFDAPGRVTAKKSFSVTSLSEGNIKTVSAAVGEPVKRGQVIALLENSELDSELAIQKDKLQMSRSTLEDLEKKVSSAEEMLSLGILSKSDLITMKQELNTLATEVRDQEIAYDRLTMRSYNYRVVADRGGYISDILPEKSFVTYGQTVAGIISLEDEQIEAFVPFDRATMPARGDRVTISCNSMTGSGKVSSVFPSANANLIGVMVAPDTPIPMNLEVKVTFKAGVVGGLMIPKSAVVIVEGKPVIFIVRNDVALKKAITVVKDYLDRVVITDNLGPDDILVIENAYLLSDQTNVKVK